MAEKKKLSVEEILAMARGKSAGSESAPAAPTSAKSNKPEKSAEPAGASKSAAPAPPGDPKKMSTADILAMARGGGEKPAAPAKAEGAKPAAKAPATPAKAGASSVADILAAARGGAKPAAAEKAATDKTPAEKPAAAKPAKVAAAEKESPVEKVVIRDNASVLGDSTAKKLGPVSKSEAVQQGIDLTKPAKAKIAVPPMPSRPTLGAPASAAPASTRRGFISSTLAVVFGSSLAIGMASLASTFVVWVLGFARYMFPNVLAEPPTRFKAGFPDTLSPGQVETKYIPQFGVWVVKNDYEGKSIIYALKSVCTHLGCTPNWLEGEQKFKCPCHGSGFYKDGVNFEGPAPRPLERYAVSLADDGQLLVDKSRTFNQELGQWTDPNSFVPV